MIAPRLVVLFSLFSAIGSDPKFGCVMNVAFKKYLIVAGFFLTLIGVAAADDAVPGVLQGHLKIVLPKTVDLADGNDPAPAMENYVEHPLIVLSADGKKEIARIIPDKNGNYRIALPPGDYLLDIHGRAPRRVRAKPQPFRVISNQTIRVDMAMDTGIR